MTESIVLLFLGACWAGYLAWYWRENRRSASRRSDGIRSFAAGLGTLGGSTGRPRTVASGVSSLGLAPRSSTDAARRRREVLFGLGLAAVLSLFAGLALGGIFLLAHIVIDIAFVAFAYAVVQRRNQLAEREMKVHMLYPDRSRSAPRERPLVGARRAVGD